MKMATTSTNFNEIRKDLLGNYNNITFSLNMQKYKSLYHLSLSIKLIFTLKMATSSICVRRKYEKIKNGVSVYHCCCILENRLLKTDFRKI